MGESKTMLSRLVRPLCIQSISIVIHFVVLVLHVQMSKSWMPMYREFNTDLREYTSTVPCPCGLKIVYAIVPTIKHEKSRYPLYRTESTIIQQTISMYILL